MVPFRTSLNSKGFRVLGFRVVSRDTDVVAEVSTSVLDDTSKESL